MFAGYLVASQMTALGGVSLFVSAVSHFFGGGQPMFPIMPFSGGNACSSQKRSLSPSSSSSDDSESDTTFTSFLEVKAIEMSSKWGVHQMKETAEKTLLRVCIIGGGAYRHESRAHEAFSVSVFLVASTKSFNLTLPDD